MADVILTKSVRVLERVGTVFGVAEFAQKDEDTGEWGHPLRLSESDWDEFGRPSTLTVTIEPGDTLNG